MCKVALLRRLLLLFVTLASLESCTDDLSSQMSFDMAPEIDDHLSIPETYVTVDFSVQEVSNDLGGMERDYAQIPHDNEQLPDQNLVANVDMTEPSEDLDLGIDMTPPYVEGAWSPHDLSGVDAYAIPNAAKIFAARHPAYRTIPDIVMAATSNTLIQVPVDIYLIDSVIWVEPEQLNPYLILVNQYFNQASIQFIFSFKEGEAPAWNDLINQFHLYFARAMTNPNGAIPDGFGNLPAGKAVINDQIMNRAHVHENPLFLPGKPIGHELGHVLGLPHVPARNFLMAQGTSARNQLDLSPEEAVVMRIMALHRFGGVLMD
ncbi:MAG: hypothetical protein CMH49_10535 [Myxococcales bacterium]|nr:hypothetical protein [Myxococcales bacterium]